MIRSPEETSVEPGAMRSSTRSWSAACLSLLTASALGCSANSGSDQGADAAADALSFDGGADSTAADAGDARASTPYPIDGSDGCSASEACGDLCCVAGNICVKPSNHPEDDLCLKLCDCDDVACPTSTCCVPIAFGDYPPMCCL
jgi:hypothetical protein